MRLFTPTVNHFESTITTTTGGTEQIDVIATGVDAPNDRGPDIPTGSILKAITVNITAQTVAAGKYQFMLLRRPGAVAITAPITAWFTTTDPMTEDSIDARRLRLSGPQTKRQVTGALVPIVFKLSWRGNLKIHDGDDIILASIGPSSTQVFDTRIYLKYLHL